MRLIEIAKFVVGIAVGLFGFVIIVGAMLGWEDRDESAVVYLAAVAGLGVLPLAAGVGLCLSARRSARRRAAETLERSVLRLAQQHGGTLTAQTLALASELSLQEAEATLKRYFEEGHCTLDLGEGGASLYHFAHLPPAPDRAADQGGAEST